MKKNDNIYLGGLAKLSKLCHAELAVSRPFGVSASDILVLVYNRRS